MGTTKILPTQRKEFVLKCLRESLAIADALYLTDRLRYKFLFGWVNGQFKRKTSPALILQTLKSLKEKEASNQKALDVAEYVGGTLRRLHQELESKKLRGGESMQANVGEVFAQTLRKLGYKVEKDGGES